MPNATCSSSASRNGVAPTPIRMKVPPTTEA